MYPQYFTGKPHKEDESAESSADMDMIYDILKEIKPNQREQIKENSA